jgi:DNA polymerase elongation subunit (family B)
MQVLKHAVVVSSFILTWTQAATAQGLYWEVKAGGGTEGQTTKAYAVPQKMKVVGADGKVMILRGDLDKFYLVNPANKSYAEFSLADLEQGAKTTRARQEAAIAEIRKQMDKLPPDQRGQAEKMIERLESTKAAAPNTLELKATGETKKILGYTCTKYVATVAGNPLLVAWTTKDIKGFKALREDWLTYQKRFASRSANASSLAEAYGKLDGFPMETDANGVKTEVTKIDPRAIPASEFEVPSGYEKEIVKMPKAP